MKYLCLLFFFAFGVSTAMAQEIIWLGNSRTHDAFLDRFFSNEDLESAASIEAGLQRLRNLEILIDAQVVRQSLDSVFISIDEAVTTFPIFTFGGIEGNQWFMVGATETNLAGRSVEGTAFYRNNNGEHNGYLSLRIPYLFGSRWGISGEAQRYAQIEPLFFPDGMADYRYVNYTFGGTIIREMGFRHSVEAGLSLLREEYSRLDESVAGAPENAEIDKVLYKAIHHLDRVHDLERLYRGWSISQNFQVIDQPGTDPFLIYWTDLRFFHLFSSLRGNLAAHVRLGLSSNRNTPFAPFVLDSQISIRGAGNRVDRGTGVAVLNLEYRQQMFNHAQFMGQLVAFSDIGNWRSPGGELDELIMEDNLAHFVGGGFRLIWKRSSQAVLRVDYGVNSMSVNQRGLVIGLGQYF